MKANVKNTFRMGKVRGICISYWNNEAKCSKFYMYFVTSYVTMNVY